jgi:hypothetical protein
VHNWLKKADVEDDVQGGLAAAEAAEVRQLKRRNRLLKEARYCAELLRICRRRTCREEMFTQVRNIPAPGRADQFRWRVRLRPEPLESAKPDGSRPKLVSARTNCQRRRNQESQRSVVGSRGRELVRHDAIKTLFHKFDPVEGGFPFADGAFDNLDQDVIGNEAI